MNNLVLKRGADREAFIAWMNENGIQFEEINGLPRHFEVEGFPDHPDIQFVEENKTLKANLQPLTINPDMTGAWQLARCTRRRPPYPSAPLKKSHDTFFNASLDGEGVDLYIIDSGISRDVTELLWDGGRFYRWYNVIADEGSNGDDNGHGTACAVLAAGSVHGFARAAYVSSYKCLSADGSGNTSHIVSAFGQARSDYLSRNRPGVVSCSIGGYGTSSSVIAAIDDMIDSGMMFFVSAGNGYEDLGVIDYNYAEADSDSVVVGGTMYDDSSYFDGKFGTNWGDRVDILAPAKLTQTIRATDAGGGPAVTRLFSGTSAACPIAAGIMACYLTGFPKLTGRTQVRAAKQFLISKATTGLVRPHPATPVLPDRIVYLDPTQTKVYIPGINV